MSATAPNSTRSDDRLDHAALLYREPDQLRAAAADFARDAAAAGEPLLVMIPPASATLLADVLEDSGAALTRVDASEAGRNPNRMIPTVLDWLPDTPARVISEAVWPGRGDAAVAECLRNEALVNVVLAGESLKLLCPYDAARLGGEVLAGAELTHPSLVDGRETRASERYGDPLEVARGERWPQSEPSPPVLHLQFVGDLWALRRTLAADELLGALHPARRDDLVFAINEAATNAIRHGDGTCRVRVWRERERVVSEIATASPIEDPMAGRRRPAVTATGGRGLWLINQLCDLVEVRSGPHGATVRMHVDVTS